MLLLIRQAPNIALLESGWIRIDLYMVACDPQRENISFNHVVLH